MSISQLSFEATAELRFKLLGRNLRRPYEVPGYWSPPYLENTEQYTPRILNVNDSPNEIENRNFQNQSYVLNSFGPNGGYSDIMFNSVSQNITPNQGEYNPNDTKLDLVNEFYIDSAFIENIYGPEGGFNNMVIIDDIQNNNKLYLPYWELSPVNFVPSTYSTYNLFISNDPSGSDGLLSQDSALARISASELKKQFQFNINRETTINNFGIVSSNMLQDPNQTRLLVTGREQIYFQNWKITVSDEPNSSNSFTSRIEGTYYPSSPIPGDYFGTPEINGGENRQTLSALNTVNRLFGNALGPIITITKNPSITFIQNTGNAQRSTLFQNLELNRYQPSYNINQNAGQTTASVNLIGNNNQQQPLVGGYYVGSRNAEPSLITSPPNQVPVNAFGKQEQAPVYGNSELGILYEGNQNTINFGLAGKSFSDGGGLDGGFVWTSRKYRGNAGFNATVGGGSGSLDSEYNLISSKYQSDESTNLTLKPSSILDQTQRLIEAADSVAGIARLKHVGNAINQVSKVFNDGYKELTKGSKVLSYRDNTTGSETGIEYCRIFAKDTPYYTYNDLQKTDGITTEGRRFTNSVLDKTYNLNIAPMRNPGSTNIQPNARGQLIAKKYMFSLENLAWRTSSRPGFTYDDLPNCEKGPNGGRIMWFPPYDLSFSDSSSPSFQPTSFLGRPEPIYTYKETSRSGTLSWKILVDHPSVLNLIVEKQLKGVNRDRINSIMDSFFAGCVKYDIYELAKKFNTIPLADLVTYQQIINEPRLTPEELLGVGNLIESRNVITGTKTISKDVTTTNDFSKEEEEFKKEVDELGFYFDNDIPGDGTTPFQNTIETYIGQKNKYKTKNTDTENFFNLVVEPEWDKAKSFIDKLFQKMNQYPETKVTLNLVGQSSSPGGDTYNINLSKRRIDSVTNFLQTYTTGGSNLKKYFDEKKIIINGTPQGEGGTSTPKAENGTNFGTITCTEKKGDEIYTINAMACRRVTLTIQSIDIPSQNSTIPVADLVDTTSEEKTFEVRRTRTLRETNDVDITQRIREGIGKKILRNLLTECDYFDVIKEDAPMIYDTIKEKIKYFNPAFHSMTPEGLNSRLTFLNQCVRPGETIPVIGVDGKPKNNDALNTSFGTPPILVLRIGDFYHTKIVPTSLSFAYENNLLDLNPEGIGVQPMMVKVSLNFNIIGGMGLAKPVEQLQNALSFNFYANTEIYDERATPTEDTSVIDKSIFDSLAAQQKLATTAEENPKPTNDGGDTIGEIVTNIPAGQVGQTGEIVYKTIMDNLLKETPTYFESVVNKLESIFKEYNYGVIQVLDRKRDYENGSINQDSNIPTLTDNNIKIYGKPEFTSDIKAEFQTCISNIENESNPIISELKTKFQSNYIEQVKKNMINYIKDFEASYLQGITTNIQDLTLIQQNYTQIIRKINLLIWKTDGKLLDTNTPRVYNLTPTTEVTKLKPGENPPADTYEELKNDYGKTIEVFGKYNDLLNEKKLAFFISTQSEKYKFNLITNEIEANFFFIMSRIITDKNKKDDFTKKVIKGPLTSVVKPIKLLMKFNQILDKLQIQYNKQINNDEKIFTQVKNNKVYKDLTKNLGDDMYKKGKERKFNYTTVPNESIKTSQETQIAELYQKKNNGNKNSFIQKYKFD